MGQDSAWGGHPEVYAVAWLYGFDITIYAQEYANTGGFLVFKRDGPKDDSCNAARTMWTLSYHGNVIGHVIWQDILAIIAKKARLAKCQLLV